MKTMVRRCRTLAQCRHGGALLEFAIVGPVVLLLCIGIVEFCLILFAQSLMEDAVNQGARLHKTGAADAAVLQQIDDETGGLLDPTKINFSSQVLSGNITLYTISYPWTVYTPLVAAITGTTITLTATGASG